MTEEPKLCFNKVDGSISVNTGDVDVDLYSDATQEEFEQICGVDQLMTEASRLLDDMLQTMGAQQTLISRGRYFDRQKALQEDAAEYYAQCVELQDNLKESESDIVTAQLGMLYKLEKFLKHYLRCLSVAQSLGYSQRLALNYAATGDYVFLYGFVRNACSTIEYLGKLVENRMGKGVIAREGSGVNCVHVYEELKRQGLDVTLNKDQEVSIPPTGQKTTMGEITLESSSIRFLKDKRNEIVHHCPLFVDTETLAKLPEDIQSTRFLTQEDATKLVYLSHRLHIHSIGIFFKFSVEYMQDMMAEMVSAWYYDR